MVRRLWWSVALSACVGVAGGEDERDAGAEADGGIVADGGSDAGSLDAGSADAGSADAGSVDAGSADAGSADAGSADAGSMDAGSMDAGSRDAGVMDAGSLDAGTPPDGSVVFDFATAPLENPLSGGGVWTNNEQGTGGNAPPGNLTSLRVGLASDGVTHIVMATHDGGGYDDSFAFVPGFSGNQFAEAVLYKAPGYDANAAGSNHEVELLLGCSSANGVRTWNEFLVNSGGGTGGPSGFQSIANVGGAFGLIPMDGDVIRATRVGNVLSLYLNGTLWTRYDGSNPNVVARGSGIGLAAFVRPGAANDKFGFRRVTMGTLP